MGTKEQMKEFAFDRRRTHGWRAFGNIGKGKNMTIDKGQTINLGMGK